MCMQDNNIFEIHIILAVFFLFILIDLQKKKQTGGYQFDVYFKHIDYNKKDLNNTSYN